MSVNSQNSRVQSTANGTTTSFPFPYLIYAAAELQVYGIDPTTGATTLYVLNTDYTIDPSEVGSGSGVNVVFGDAPVNGTAMTILRVVPFTQPTQYVEGAAVTAKVQQRTVDELCFQIQQLADQASRTPSLPPTNPIGAVPVPNFANDYQAYDVSVGSTPQVSISPGNHRDSTGGQTVIPTVGGGSPITTLPAPKLTLGSNNTVIFFKIGKDAATGAMTTLDIIPADTMPDDTIGFTYQLLTNVVVSIVDGLASVAILGGGVRGSQNYFYCGPIPLVDASGALLNS